MRPTLFSLPMGGRGLDVHAYGFMIALGVVAGVLLAVRRGRRTGLDTAAVLDLTFWCLIAGIAGSRLLYVMTHAAEYGRLCVGTGVPRSGAHALRDCAAPLFIWQGGLVFYGGALAATAVVLWMARKHRWSLGEVADLLAPSVAIGHVFGRLGCLMAGCCYGKACAWGLRFPRASVAYQELAQRGQLAAGAPATPTLHATQAYEALAELIVFVALIWWSRRRRFAGAVALAYAMCYAALRSLIEAFRGDRTRGFVVEILLPRVASWLGLPPSEPLLLSSAQAVSLVVMAAAIVAYSLLRRGSRPAAE